MYNLSVIDCSEHGLGLLITKEDEELLDLLNPGDVLKEITFFSTSAMITVGGQVKHKTKMEEGRYRDCYLLGIESPEVIENCRPQK